MYHPWRSARSQPNLLVAEVMLPVGRSWWLPEEDAILLNVGLLQTERRCALAHELVHRERGDSAMSSSWWRARQECAVEAIASRRLITLDDLVEALLWSQNEHELAEWLWVDVETIRARLTGLSEQERDLIEARLWEREESA